MRALLIVIVAALAAACSMPFGAGGDSRALLVNQTRNAFVYSAIELKDAPLFDPMPAVDPARASERVVAAGGQAALDLPDYSGTGVLVFLYEIPSQDHAGPVPLSRAVRVTHGELLRMHHRIVIDEE
jgi:hypothetical protein